MARFRTAEELAGLESELARVPKDVGTVDLVVRRPAAGQREVLDEASLTFAEGLVGDRWSASRARHLDTQINVMGSRVISFLAGSPDRRPLAGDQLYLDLDLSLENLPAGSRLAVGTAVIVVVAKPHTGCRKFLDHFGRDATGYLNSPSGRAMRLRGLNARVVIEGVVRPGDKVSVESRGL